MNLKHFIKLFLLCCISFSFTSNVNKNKRYCSTILDYDVNQLFYNLVDTQDDIYQQTFSSVYFSNLRENFAENTHGTCSFVAIEMLLTFFDTYWNDNFVDEDYDNPTIVDSYTTDIALTQTLPSPGVYPNLISDTENMSNAEYQEYIEENINSNLHFYLINYAKTMFGINLNEPNPYALTITQELNLLYYYLVYSRSITTNLFTFDSVDENYSREEIISFVLSNILNGVPVVLNISSDIGNHTVVAYDVDEFNNVYVHSGWKDDYGNALTHLDINDIPNSEIESAFVMIMTNYYSPSNNYKDLNGHTINIKNFGYPSNVRETGEPRMLIEWDSLWNEKWFDCDNEDIYFCISFVNEIGSVVSSQYVAESNNLVCSLISYLSILESASDNDDYFTIKIEAICDTDRHYGEFYCASKNVILASNSHEIFPSDYQLSLRYSTSTITTSLPECQTNDGYTFRRNVHRASLFNNSVVLSAKGGGNSEAFIEYQFLTGICQFDVDISYFSNPMNEGLVKGTYEFRIEEFRGRKYTTLVDLLREDIDLSHNRNDKTTLSLSFTRPTFRIRIYLKSNEISYDNTYLGRVCIGNVKVYDSNKYCLPLNGWELEYDEQFWDNFVICLNHNCYTYAVNYHYSYLSAEWNDRPAAFNPGIYSNPELYEIYNSDEFIYDVPFYYSPHAILQMVKCDFDSGVFGEGTFVIKRTNKMDLCEEGTYKVALVFDLEGPNIDYHWLRQNSDGTWSHKLAERPILNTDADESIILDPDNCNLNFPNAYNYNANYYDVAYFMVTPVAVLGEENL